MAKDKNEEEKPKKENEDDPFYVPDASNKRDSIPKSLQENLTNTIPFLQRLLNVIQKDKDSSKK